MDAVNSVAIDVGEFMIVYVSLSALCFHNNGTNDANLSGENRELIQIYENTQNCKENSDSL